MTTAMTMLDVQIGRRALLFLFLIALLPLFAVKFADGNQIEQFSIIARLLDPGFAPKDMFLDSAAQLGQPRYYYSWMIAQFTKLAPLPVVIHTLSVLCGFLLGLTTYVAAQRFLQASATGALIAAMLVLLNHGISIGHAGYLVFSNFQPATIAIATALTGVTALAAGRVWWATVLFIFAALMHPTIGAEVAMIGYFAVFVGSFVAGQRAGLAQILVGGLVFLVALAIAWALPNMGHGGEKLTSGEFFSILIDFRAPHHYQGSTFPKQRWLEAGLFVVCISWLLVTARKSGLPKTPISILAILRVTVVVLCLASLYFVDIAESRLWSTAQLFRMVLILKWVGYLLIGWTAGRWIAEGRPADLLLAALLILPTADALPYALLAVLVTRAAIARLRLEGIVALAACLPALAVAMYYQNDLGKTDQLLRLVVAGLALFCLNFRARGFGAALATAGVLAFIAMGFVARDMGIGPSRYHSEATLAARSKEDVRLALLARDFGPKDAMWLVPPRLETFRYVAGRPVVVDYTAIPFDDAGLREWRDRMNTLYGETDKTGFAALREMTNLYRTEPPLDVARDIYGADYAVLFADTPFDGEELDRLGKYKLVKLAP